MNLVLNFNGISQEKLRWKVAIYKGVKRRYAKKLEAAADKQGSISPPFLLPSTDVLKCV
jgi:hypothetical protein